MAGAAHHPAIGYVLPAPGADALPRDLARCCDFLAERAPIVEPDPPAGAWFALREGQRVPSPATSGAALLADLEHHGFPGARLALAPTPGIARLAALVAAVPLTILHSDSVSGFLRPLPVETLGLGGDATDHLHLVGLHTLGALAALPRGVLGDYLGFLAKEVEALARGEDGRPLRPRHPPLVLRARRDLDWPVADRAMLAALLDRLVAPPLAELARQGFGARSRRVVARLPAPTVAVPAVLAALLAAADDALAPTDAEGAGEDGGASDGDAAPGITAVALVLTAPRPLPVKQASFFDVPQGRLAQLHAGLAEARRRGDGAVGYLRWKVQNTASRSMRPPGPPPPPRASRRGASTRSVPSPAAARAARSAGCPIPRSFIRCISA